MEERTKRGSQVEGIVIEGREDNVVWGIILVGMGIVFLLIQIGRLSWIDWALWWPYAVILAGVGQLVTPSSPKRIGSGATLVVLGGWFLIATHHWHGLDWEQTWPLSLVAIGMGMVVRAIASMFMRPRKEINNVATD